MKIRTKYIAFVVLLHLVAWVLSLLILRNHTFIFLAAEVLILVSVVISWQLYRQLIRPLKMLTLGAQAIRERDFSVKFLSTGNHEMDQLIRIYNEMIDQLRTERTLKEQQHFFLEKLIDTSPTGIIILDYDDNIQQVNPKALQLLHLEKEGIKGRSVNEVLHPVISEIRQLSSGHSKTISLKGGVTHKIQKSHFIDRGFSRHFIMIEELTAEIAAAEKKAYGKVIRMMAHEVNNTIGPVNSIIESALSKEKVWLEGTLDPLQNALQVAMERNHNLNMFMRRFSDVVRLPEPHRKKIDLNLVIHSVAALMQMKAKERDIIFRYELAEGPFYVLADEQQMEQVLINVVKNSIEAIEEKGMVCFSTNSARNRLVVSDTGKGIDADASEMLFSPFFSTKKEGQGIGLTLVKEILMNHRFEFSLESPVEGETRFMIQFR